MLTVKSKGLPLTEGLNSFVQTRVHWILSRYGQRVSRVDVTLLDINGPKGGEDKRCRIKLKIDGRPSIIIQETDADIYDAIYSCGVRLKRTMRRELDKEREKIRLSLPTEEI